VNIKSEQDTTEGFSVRILMSMGTSLAELKAATQTAFIQYDAMAAQYGLQSVADIEASL
jgi:hypothetical protein